MQIKGPPSSSPPPNPAPKPAAASTAPPQTPVTAAAVSAAEKMIQGWRIGQILQAVVRPGSTNNTPLLAISGRLLQIRNPPSLLRGATQMPVAAPTGNADSVLNQPQPLPAPLQIGQRLQLSVSQTGPNTVLRVLNVQNSPTPAITPEQAIRAALPRQLPLTSVLATLQAVSANLSQTGQANTASLPDSLITQARQIIAQLPSRDAVTQAEGLQQAVARSGIFLEAQLADALRARTTSAETAQQLSGDLKGGLLGLLSLLLGLGKTANAANKPAAAPNNTVPPPLANSQPFAQPRQTAAHLSAVQQSLPQLLQELFKQVDSGLARIQLSQLASSPKEDDVQRSWLLDLPLRHGEQIDVLQLRINEERRGKGKDTDKLWSVALAFELEGLGIIHVRVTLTGGLVNATFWAEQGPTAELFKQHLTDLQQRLQTAGLNVGKLATHHGAPQTADNSPALPYVLLDVEA